MPLNHAMYVFGTRACSLLAVVVALRLWRASDAPGLASALAMWALWTLLRAPRRRLVGELAVALSIALVETACAMEGRAAYGDLYLAMGALALCIPLVLAPQGRSALPMNGLDRYFVCQDYEGMRVNSHHFVDVSEQPSREALHDAVEALLAEMPIARSFVHQAVLGMERFVASRPWVGAGELVQWLEKTIEADYEVLDAPIDLAERPPWRVIVAPRREGGWRIVLTIHHSAADGTGGMLWLSRLLKRYEESRTGKPPGRLPADPPARRFRELFRPQGTAWLLRMVRRHVRPMDKVGVRNASLLDDEAPRLSESAHALCEVPDAEWARLKARAEELGVSRNDLLVTASLRAADGWRRARQRPDQRFRILLPTDLRPALDLPPSFQNFVGVVRSDFSAEEVRAEGLPRLVSERVKLGRTLDEAIETPVNLGFLSAVLPPGLFRLLLRNFDNDPRSFFFSYLFSQVRIPSDLPRPPGTERVWVRGSLPRQPGFGIVVCPDGERVTVAFEYLEAYVSEASVADYRDRFLAEISRA
ncbi:MAG: hypothetical protein AAB434_04840 [Planctomycetota bacterium]